MIAQTFHRKHNGPEFISCEIKDWLKEAEIQTLYFNLASPRERLIQCLHDTRRDERAKRALFGRLKDAKSILENDRRRPKFASAPSGGSKNKITSHCRGKAGEAF